MSRWRMLLALVATAAVVVGVGLMATCFERRITIHSGDGEVVATGISQCGRPLVTSFDTGDDSGWFAYAPGTSPVFPDGFGCRNEARVRTGAGAAIAVAGLATLMFVWRARRDQSETEGRPAAAV